MNRFDWSDVDGGFAYVRNEVIIPVDDLPTSASDQISELGQNVRNALQRLLDELRPDSTPPERETAIAADPEDAFAAVEDLINGISASTSSSVDRAKSLVAEYGVKVDDAELIGQDRFVCVRGTFEPVAIVSALRGRGIAAQPNHAFWLHDDRCCCCTPHPATTWTAPGVLSLLNGTIGGNPKSGIKGSPKSGIKGSPKSGIKGSPKSGIKGSGSSAQPTATPPGISPSPLNLPWGSTPRPRVVILDTGLPTPQFLTHFTTGEPGALADAGDNASRKKDPSGAPLAGPDGYLDEAGGHGGFIASIIERLAPGTPARIWNVLDPWANELVDEVTLCGMIDEAVNLFKQEQEQVQPPEVPKMGIISMSLGGPVWEEAGRLADAIAAAQLAGVVIVASAGNDATCTPQYPAALPGVVSVGAIGPDGPAEFTNYGPWVRCCAPGVDVVGKFFSWNFDAAPNTSGDPDLFEGWALWSGTSFAVPAVVAALLRDMAHNSRTAQDAVKAVIDAPHLGRIPGLGTVVNI